MDQQLAAVFAKLGPVREDTVVIITADHGEVLNDQLGYFDHHGLYDAVVRIPLIMSMPGTLPTGRRVPGMVQNLDLAQTVLDLTGIPQRQGMEGLSLLPCLYGVRDGNYSEVFLSEATWQVKRAVRTDRWKLIRSIEPDRHGRPINELFDLESDPDEQHNIAEERPEVVAELEQQLDAWLARRLAETGREVDPVAEQGLCATQIGEPIPGETVGAGATPLHERVGARAATVPDPNALNAGTC
jgi:arylsulfatase A-like enzyme